MKSKAKAGRKKKEVAEDFTIEVNVLEKLHKNHIIFNAEKQYFEDASAIFITSANLDELHILQHTISREGTF